MLWLYPLLVLAGLFDGLHALRVRPSVEARTWAAAEVLVPIIAVSVAGGVATGVALLLGAAGSLPGTVGAGVGLIAGWAMLGYLARAWRTTIP